MAWIRQQMAGGEEGISHRKGLETRLPGTSSDSPRQSPGTLKGTPWPGYGWTCGGWKTFETVLECYQQHDQETMRTALEAREATRESGQVTA